MQEATEKDKILNAALPELIEFLNDYLLRVTGHEVHFFLGIIPNPVDMNVIAVASSLEPEKNEAALELFLESMRNERTVDTFNIKVEKDKAPN